MIRASWHFFKLPYLVVGTFWPKPWHFFVLRTWHPCLTPTYVAHTHTSSKTIVYRLQLTSISPASCSELTCSSPQKNSLSHCLVFSHIVQD